MTATAPQVMTGPGAGMRCYGYTPEGDIVPDEAQVIRAAVDAALGGQPLRQVMDVLNAEGVRTTTGREWQLTPLVRLLTNPRLAGLAPKRRGSAQPAPAIITRAEHEALLAQAIARRTGAAPRQRGYAATRLLSGLVKCGRCGADMHAHANAHGRAYRCPDTGLAGNGAAPACGRTQIQAEHLEQHVTDVTLDLLADPGTYPVVVADPAATIEARLTALDAYRASLQAAKESGTVGEAEYQAARKRIKQRRQMLRDQLAAAAAAPPPSRLPRPERAQAWWKRASLEDRRAVLAALWQAVEIGEPTQRGVGGLDTGRVRLVRA